MVTEDNYADVMSRAQCQTVKDCYLGFFEDNYSDMADCYDEVGEIYEQQVDYYEAAGCELEVEDAQDCLSAWRNVSCEEYYEYTTTYTGELADECVEVWDCY